MLLTRITTSWLGQVAIVCIGLEKCSIFDSQVKKAKQLVSLPMGIVHR